MVLLVAKLATGTGAGVRVGRRAATSNPRN